MLSDKALKNVRACLCDLDELIDGRFIFAENMIAKILQDISQSDEIYELISECMKNFNFDKEFSRAKVKLPTKDGYFIMPESKAIVLPLVFCIFVDIRDKKINFRDFLKNYFQSEGIDEFENFAKTVVVPFRDCISYCFDMDSYPQKQLEKVEQKPQEIVEETPQIQKQDIVQKAQSELKSEKAQSEKEEKIFENIKQICKQMIQNLEQEKHIKVSLKDDLTFLLNNMIIYSDKNDITNISAFVVALNYMAKNVKSIRFLYIEMKNVLAQFYSD